MNKDDLVFTLFLFFLMSRAVCEWFKKSFILCVKLCNTFTDTRSQFSFQSIQ